MSNIKAISNNDEHQEALRLLDSLMERDPEPDSDDGQKIKVLAILIEKYESEHFSIDLPTALEAIEHRMDQLDMKPADLVPYIGSASRVSEVLSGKRQLTRNMISKLEEHLEIPATVLLKQSPIATGGLVKRLDQKLLATMQNRGYFASYPDTINLKEKAEKFFSELFNGSSPAPLLRQSKHRSDPRTSNYALEAWAKRVIDRSSDSQLKPYRPGSIDAETMGQVAKLSVKDKGPVLAQRFLINMGVDLVIEKHLPKTHLDGALLRGRDDRPIIGLTLRYDRLDNFWFTLMHELAHLALHFDGSEDIFFDELDKIKGQRIDAKEQEADALTCEALVPASKWILSPVRVLPTPVAIESLANELGVDPVIIYGRVRFETGKWGYFSEKINKDSVEAMFRDYGGGK